MTHKTGILLILIALVSASLLPGNFAYADWIREGYFSEAAGIDSLERFLVVRDVAESTYLGYNITRLGDINDDNIGDVLIGRADYLPGQDHNNFLFLGGNPPDDFSDEEFIDFTIHIRNIGDVNLDGYDDIARCDGISRKLYVYFGGPLLDDLADRIIDDVWTYPPKAGDIDADGTLELALNESLNEGDVRVYRLGNDFDSYPEYVISDTARYFGSDVATGDFNGDGFTDVAVSAHLNRDSCFVNFYWGGPDFDTTADFVIFGFNNRLGEFLLPVGDFNGDGYEDIFIGGSSPKRYGIYYGGPELDGEIDVVTNHSYGTTYNVPYAVDVAGDVNNDGYPDFIYSHIVGYLTEIYILLGGPDADSVYDVNIENYDMPGSQNHFGTALAGIADFNGDGIDDFAVRSQTEPSCCWWSEVNFFAGWDSQPNDVGYEYKSTLPQEFRLKDNYPNPFNLSTTIEFDVPYKAFTTLSIYNILGEKINSLISRELSAGSYKLFWDGKDKTGLPVSSGVYFCRLSAGDASQTRKLVLLK